MSVPYLRWKLGSLFMKNEIFTLEHKGDCEYMIGLFTVVNKIAM